MNYNEYTAKLATLTELFIEDSRIWGKDITREQLEDFIREACKIVKEYQQRG